MGIPLQHQMNMDEPEEHILWGLVNMGERVGAPLLLPEGFMREFSRHLYRCGFRHHPELQEIWYKPPTDDASIFQGIGGEWVESEFLGVKPEMYSREEVLDKLVEALPDSDRRLLLDRLGVDDGGSAGGQQA